jgi:hypothetical protein
MSQQSKFGLKYLLLGSDGAGRVRTLGWGDPITMLSSSAELLLAAWPSRGRKQGLVGFLQTSAAHLVAEGLINATSCPRNRIFAVLPAMHK